MNNTTFTGRKSPGLMLPLVPTSSPTPSLVLIPLLISHSHLLPSISFITLSLELSSLTEQLCLRPTWSSQCTLVHPTSHSPGPCNSSLRLLSHGKTLSNFSWLLEAGPWTLHHLGSVMWLIYLQPLLCQKAQQGFFFQPHWPFQTHTRRCVFCNSFPLLE